MDWDKLSDWYGLGLAKTGAGSQVVELSGIDANRVVDVKVGFFSQSVGNEVLLFLMDDGSIEYIPIANVAREHNFHSYGKVAEVEDILAIKQIEIGESCFWGATMIAQRADGSTAGGW